MHPIGLCLIALAGALASTNPSIDVTVRAPWPTGPSSFLLEASEFISEEDPDGQLFWRFFNASTTALRQEASAHGFPSSLALSSKPIFPITLARSLLAPITLDVLRVSLAARAASPAVESHRQLSLQSPGRAHCTDATTSTPPSAWVDVVSLGGAVFSACSAGELEGALASAGGAQALPRPATPGVTYPWDHTYPHATPAAQLAAEAHPLIILYADLGRLGGGVDSDLATATASAVASGSARGVYRHALAPAPPGSDDTTWLAGFGAALDIKSTEYKTIDEREAKAASAAADTAAAAATAALSGSTKQLAIDALRLLDTTVPAATVAGGSGAAGSSGSGSGSGSGAWEGGVNWEAITAKAGKPLGSVRAEAAKRSGSSPTSSTPSTGNIHLDDVSLEPWQCSDLGLQAAAYVMDAASREALAFGGNGSFGEESDPLAALVRVTGNFPTLAPWLSSLPVPPILRSEVKYNSRFVHPGTATMTMNGITVEASSNFFNLFSLFTTLRSEARTVEMLDTLPLSLEDRRRVLGLAYKEGVGEGGKEGGGEEGGEGKGSSKGGGKEGGGEEEGAASGDTSTLRVDMLWEREEVLPTPYDTHPLPPAQWIQDVEVDSAFSKWPSDVRMLMQPTWQLHQIRRNLYTAVGVMELAPIASLRALEMMLQLKAMKIPIRMGVAFLPGKSEEEVAALGLPLTTPLPPFNHSAPATSLQLALLATAATAKFGPSHGGIAFISALVKEWSSAGAALQEASMREGGGGGEVPGVPPIAPPPTVGDALTALAALASQPKGWHTAAAGAHASSTTGSGGKKSVAAATPPPPSARTLRTLGESALEDATGALRAALLAGPVAWAKSRGVPSPSIFFNGKVLPGLDFQSSMMPAVQQDLSILQQAVYKGALDENVAPSVLHAFLGKATRLSASNPPPLRGSKKGAAAAAAAAAADASLATTTTTTTTTPPILLTLPGAGQAISRFHPAIFAGEEEQHFLPLSAPSALPLVSAIPYIHAPGTSDEVKPVSLTLVEDLSTASGLVSAAALVAYVSGGSDKGEGVVCPGGSSLPTSLCLGLPLPTFASQLRVGFMHVAPLFNSNSTTTTTTSTPPSHATVGHAVQLCASLITGAAPSLVEVRSSDQGPAVAAIVSHARAAVKEKGEGAAALSALLASLQSWLGKLAKGGGGSSSSGGGGGEGASGGVLRPKAAENLAKVLEDTFPSSTTSAPPLSTAVAALFQAHHVAADIARTMLPASLPFTRSVVETATPGVSAMRVRGLLANGRLLALSGGGGGGGGDGCEDAPTTTTAAAAATSVPPSLTLGPCATVEDLGLVANTERISRGAAVAKLLHGVTFPPSRLPDANPDALTAEWISSVVMGAASAVGATSRVGKSGGGGGAMASRGRIAMRTGLLAREATSFTSRPRPRGISNSSSSSSSGGGGKVDGEEGSIGLTVTAIIDPSSTDAQKAAPLLLLLRDALGATVTVHLVPPPEGTTSDLPIKSFFRYVLPGKIGEEEEEKGEEGGGKSGHASSSSYFSSSLRHPRAVFSWLPPSSLLTLKLATPEPWNVQLSQADVDCDNMKLSPGQHVGVEYALKDLLVAGQCLDSTGGGAAFPNGLQLTLGPRGRALAGAPAAAAAAAAGGGGGEGAGEGGAAEHPLSYPSTPSDTLVMMNLGYWQLKAQPGVWSVELAPGRATELFTLLSSGGGGGGGGGGVPNLWGYGMRVGGDGGEGSATPTPALSVVVRDFTGPFTTLKVRKLPGKEGEALLSTLGSGEGGGGGRIASTSSASKGSSGGLFSSLFGGGGKGKAVAATPSTGTDKPLVHVFSIASGHLYERFLKIMMLSAIKRSPSVRLKFWLVENFLSPQFKATAPALVAHFGAEVGFVTYKWPNWLRGQSEKQRLIWGYKILFLDVLFPLDVERIIYVDADQILRTDLRELAEMDLQGAPYAFTPFCDSRKETLGYQFWREGFWKDHLRGRPYHISALYVVDLVAFRRSAVGDQLRATYEQLSRDPNSLANLDQDLPNFAQTSIPIHSLPQEWLWCESWCSDDSKAAAKTIDLCNNPRFKEPKLNMARRVINGTLFPESWDQLDTEVQRLSAEVDSFTAAASAAAAAASGAVGEAGVGTSSSTTSKADL